MSEQNGYGVSIEEMTGSHVAAVGVTAPETGGASRSVESSRIPPTDSAARVLSIAIRVLAERAFPWVTLLLCAVLWFCVTLLAETTPRRIVAAVLFTIFTHVPTWGVWKRAGA